MRRNSGRGAAAVALKRTSKELLADAIKELMRTRELKDISVESILELSGVSRATFYKHFYCKQELAEYVFLQELANVSFFDYGRPIHERETEILTYLDENRTFYRNALKSQEFRDAWMRAAYRADREYLAEKYAGRGVDPADLELFANLLSRAMVDATWLWITNPDGRDAAELARKLATFVERGTSGLIEPHGLEL